MKVVYKLFCKDSNIEKFYIGSSKNFKKRLTDHKSRCKYSNRDVYKYIREHGGWSNWTYEFIEEYEDGFDKHLLKERESYHIKSTWDMNLNTSIPYSVGDGKRERGKIYKKIYQQENKIKIAEKKKIYRQQNKIKIAEKKKIYRQQNKNELAEKKKIYHKKYKVKRLEKAKIYYKQNKIKILEKMKIYQEKNRVKILERLKIKIDCGFCGLNIRKDSMKRHKLSKKCKLIQDNL